MSFYSSIHQAYDEIFPLNKMQANFVESIYPVLSGKQVLDAGCGTGSLAIELGRRGAAISAFDIDEDMIATARHKCPQALNVQFAQNNLLRFGEGFKKHSFDLVYCFGNTLAHLKGEAEINLFIKSVKSVLKPGGSLLIQVVNYDRILSGSIKQLPTIESDHYIFERNYSICNENEIKFSTVLINKNSNQVLEQSVPLFPIKKDLIALCLDKDFERVKYYGNFKKEDWSTETFHTIVEAKFS